MTGFSTVLPAGRKRRGEGHTRREEILQAAKELFLEQGYDSTTIRRIADRVRRHLDDEFGRLRRTEAVPRSSIVVTDRPALRVLAHHALDPIQIFLRLGFEALQVQRSIGMRFHQPCKLLFIARSFEKNRGLLKRLGKLQSRAAFDRPELEVDRLAVDGDPLGIFFPKIAYDHTG